MATAKERTWILQNWKQEGRPEEDGRFREWVMGSDRVHELVPRLVDHLAAALTTLKDMQGIIDESTGVVGWHRNGAVANWGEFEFTQDLEALMGEDQRDGT